MEPLLAVTSASVRGRLEGVSVSVGTGEMVAVVGPNGAGKSTLLSACLGLLPLDGGEVRVDGRGIADLGARERAAWLGWLPQRPGGTGGLTAREVVAAARFRFGERQVHALARADAILEARGLGGFAGRALHSLSGGERQRVRLAALVAQEARLWLLDEPGNHLDPSSQLALVHELTAEVRAGLGAMLVTHDVTVLPHLGGVPTRVLGLADGRPVFEVALEDPDLAQRLGDLLALELRWVPVGEQRRLVVVGRR